MHGLRGVSYTRYPIISTVSPPGFHAAIDRPARCRTLLDEIKYAIASGLHSKLSRLSALNLKPKNLNPKLSRLPASIHCTQVGGAFLESTAGGVHRISLYWLRSDPCHFGC